MVDVKALKAGWSPNHGSYVALLQEIDGKRYYPVFVDEWEAKIIDLLINQKIQQPYKLSRLFQYLLDRLNSHVVKVKIFKLFGDVLARIIYWDRKKTRTLTYSPAEAIQLAVLSNASIEIQESLLLGTEKSNKNRNQPRNEEELLKEKLQKAIEIENYEEAARLRDKIFMVKKARYRQISDVSQ